ncbi:LysE family translocator [Dyella subtropica]|uniref:LysE family translocator n=1 Tax=Dyella subtropica TaxID=2992127 RepID=UPI00225BCEE5|nr:LysE family translocator [Dyella subtropica]
MIASLALFALSAAVVVAVPGPTTLLAMHNGASGGLCLAACGVAGAVLSDLLLMAAVAAGISALLATSVLAFVLIQYVGAAYLAWLAFKLWQHPQAIAPEGQAATPSCFHAFARSLLAALGNPKGWLFFLALLPPFVHPQQNLATQYLRLALLFVVIDAVLMSGYALVGIYAARGLSPRYVQLLHRGAALTMLVLAVSLLLYAQPHR